VDHLAVLDFSITVVKAIMPVSLLH